MALIELEAVRFRYEDMAMRFDLAVEAGEFVAIVGPSGAGKSTLLNLIAGFDPAEAGTIRIASRDVTRVPAAARPVTTLFQEHNLFPHLSAADNVGLGLHPGLKLEPEQRARAQAALARVGLDGLGERLPGQLSGGERQRVALARALVRERPVLLLDEPFAALGPSLRREMVALVDELRRDRGLTVLMVSHQLEDARGRAERALFVENGRILAEGTVADFLERPPRPEIRDYL